MHDQVVALKDKADCVVPIRVPVPVPVFFCRYAVDNEIAAVIAVESADDIEQRRLAGAAGPEDRDKFVVPQIETHAAECLLDVAAGLVLFSYILDLKHFISFSLKQPVGNSRN